MSASSLSDPAVRKKYGVVERNEFIILEKRVKDIEESIQGKHFETSCELQEMNNTKTYTQTFLDEDPYNRRKGLDSKVINITDNLEVSLRKEFDMKNAALKNILDEFQEENKALKEEVLLLREGLMEILDLLVKHKSRSDFKETVATETI
jgi:hypothetical protein